MAFIRGLSELVAIPFEVVISFVQIFSIALKDLDRAKAILQALRDYTEVLKVRKPFWDEED